MDAYWQNEVNPWVNSGRTIGQALMIRQQLPALQRQAQAKEAMFGAQMNEMNEKTRLTRAQADEVGTKNQREKMQLNAALKVQEIMSQPGNVTQDKAGNITIAAPALQGAMAYLAGMGTDASDAAGGIGSLLKAANQAPQFQQSLAQKSAQPMHVTPGGAVYDPGAGKVIYQNPSAAAAEQQFETITTDYPAVDAVPGIPEHKEGGLPVIGGFIGMGGRLVAATPGIPGQPARKVTVRKLIHPSQPAEQPPVAPVAPVAPAAPAAGDKVRVQHPSGQFGYIPAEQLQDALSQGFKLAPGQ